MASNQGENAKPAAVVGGTTSQQAGNQMGVQASNTNASAPSVPSSVHSIMQVSYVIPQAVATDPTKRESRG